MRKNRHIIVGTAGHVDHGRTELVRALTGVNTDRLREEQERGIYIELGFAPLHLPSGDWVGLVDVPGHERFVKAMVAGAAGMDLGLLIVAADESVMPQTREHLDVMQLLGLRGGVVVLTKCDLVDDETADVVAAEVEDLVRGTFLPGSRIVRTSTLNGRGLEELLAALDEATARLPPKPTDTFFRLPVGSGLRPDGTRVYVTDGVGNRVFVLDTRTTSSRPRSRWGAGQLAWPSTRQARGCIWRTLTATVCLCWIPPPTR